MAFDELCNIICYNVTSCMQLDLLIYCAVKERNTVNIKSDTTNAIVMTIVYIAV